MSTLSDSEIQHAQDRQAIIGALKSDLKVQVASQVTQMLFAHSASLALIAAAYEVNFTELFLETVIDVVNDYRKEL